MSPMHIAPFRAIRIVLVIKMIDAVFIKHTIRVIHPAIAWRMVVKRAIVVCVFYIPFVRKSQVPFLQKGYSCFVKIQNLNRAFFTFIQRERHFIIDLVNCQAHVHPRVARALVVQ